jgi:hypothetical protein
MKESAGPTCLLTAAEEPALIQIALATGRSRANVIQVWTPPPPGPARSIASSGVRAQTVSKSRFAALSGRRTSRIKVRSLLSCAHFFPISGEVNRGRKRDRCARGRLSLSFIDVFGTGRFDPFDRLGAGRLRTGQGGQGSRETPAGAINSRGFSGSESAFIPAPARVDVRVADSASRALSCPVATDPPIVIAQAGVLSPPFFEIGEIYLLVAATPWKHMAAPTEPQKSVAPTEVPLAPV